MRLDADLNRSLERPNERRETVGREWLTREF